MGRLRVRSPSSPEIVLIVALAAAGIAIGGLLVGRRLCHAGHRDRRARTLRGRAGWHRRGDRGAGQHAAAGAAIAILTAVIWLIDIVVPALGLPAFVHDLALTAHFGQPMLGVWDPVGIVVSLLLAVGGVAIGAWGFARRDLRA